MISVLTYLLAEVSYRLVVLVEHNADFIHEPDLLRIVAIQLRRAGVDVGEETQYALRGNGLRLGYGS